MVRIPSNMPNPEDVPEARRIYNLHLEGKDNEIPYEGMMLTTMLAKARRTVNLEHGPEYFDMELFNDSKSRKRSNIIKKLLKSSIEIKKETK